MLTTVHYLPIACFILLPFSFIITYLISVLNGHCEAAWPYISDTGVYTPESCIFSQLLNIASALIALTVVIRYKQVEQQCRDSLLPDASRVFALNKWSLIIGLLSTAGISVVANFQELKLFTVHMIGASSAFGFGLIYCATQTQLSYYMYPIVESGLIVARCRLVISIIYTIAFILTIVLGPIAYKLFTGSDPTKWKPTDGGYLYHVISSVCEWITALAIDAFILSFAHEFKYMSISSPKFYMVSTVANVQGEAGSESDESNYNTTNVVVTANQYNNNQATTSTRSTRR